ncbi:sigma-70 family RNA polymerase sigma factor [Roseburia hominis]
MRITKDNFLSQLRKRNEKALEFVLEEYGGLLMSIIRKHLFCLPGLQEECMNDVLLKIWKHISQFDESKSSFRNWAAGVARYQAIDYLRKYIKEMERCSLEEVEEGREDVALMNLLEQEISEEVEQMLSCLCEEDQKLFLKLFYEEKNVEEISRETGLRRETIYNRISRGKRKIRNYQESREGH